MTNCEAIIMVEAANVRSLPTLSAAIVGIANRGMRLPILERTPNAQPDGFFWFQVDFINNMRGWLRADLIQVTGDCAALNVTTTTPTEQPSSMPSPEQPETPESEEPIVLIGDCRAEVKVFSATVRRGPSLKNPIAGFLARGTAFAITDISDADDDGFRWYGLEFKGETGWVREDLVNETGDCLDPRTHIEPSPTTVSTQPVEPATPCMAVIALPKVNVRTLPTRNSNSLGMATNAQQLPVRNVTDIQTDGFRWVEITFNGATGFIRADLVTLTGNCAEFQNTGLLPRPVSGRMTQDFRPPSNPTHNGIDIGTGGNQELRAPLPAIVERAMSCVNCTAQRPNIFTTDRTIINQIFNDANWGFGYGNHVILKFKFADLPAIAQQKVLQAGGNQNISIFVLFAHLSEIRVSLGQQISIGTVFGVTGNTGFSSAHHLHLEVAFGKTYGTATKVHPSTIFNLV